MSAGSQPRIVGRYELHNELAAGGMATVHIGRSIGAAGFAKSVAIKRLHPNLARDPELVTVLLDEARLSERIRHPNVVATLDVVAADHELLLVMEYVHGETLARLLKACAADGVRCPPPVAGAIAHGVLLGLHAAHNATDAQGEPLCVVHRDVSPQNIIVGADGVPRLLDFGIAKALGAASHTREGEVKGKVPYMAPEILRLEQATPQSDVYAVAVTLWESLCARRLFRADSEVGVWGMVLDGEVPRPGSVVGPLGPIEDVVMRGLARPKGERFPNAMAMAHALEHSTRLASSAEIAAWVAERAADSLAERSSTIRAIERLPARPAEVVTRPSVTPPAVAVAVPPPPSRRWGRWAALTTVVLAALGVLMLRGAGLSRARATDHVPVEPTPAPSEAPSVPVASPSASTLVPLAPPTGVLPQASGVPPQASGVPVGRPRRPLTTPATSTGRPRGVPDPCDPPYTLDEAGRKHFKLNCVN